jgi:hypothetical protein
MRAEERQSSGVFWNMRFFASLFGLLLVALLSRPAFADSWLLPKLETTYSPNKAFRFTTTPRDVKSQLTYFETKAAGKDLPVAPAANGRLEKLVGNEWQLVWTSRLDNEVAPVEVMISDDGSNVITFDNWASVGFGDNVVVIYGREGKLVRKFSLEDLMPPYVVQALPHSVSSIWWRGEGTAVNGNMLAIPIAGPGEVSKRTTAFVRQVELTNGALEPLPAETSSAFAPLYCETHIGIVRDYNAYLEFERQDLVYPAADDRDGWTRFQYQLIQRTKPKMQSNDLDTEFDGAFEMPVAGDYMFKESRRMYQDALTGDAKDTPLRWLSGLDLDSMTLEIERTAKRVKPNQLVGVELRFITDSAHWPRIQSAMSKSAATLVFVDRNNPVPQRPEVLATLPAKEKIDQACLQYVK